MAVVQPPFFMQTGSHPASTFRRPLEALLRLMGTADGVVTPAALLVSAGAGRSVDVALGEVFVNGTQNQLLQGCYHVINDATVNVPLAVADPANPRDDLIIARVYDQEYGDGTSAGAIEVVTGVPAVAPAEPAVPANSFVLGKVRVGAGVVSIVAGNITDRRYLVGEWTTFTPTFGTTAAAGLSVGNGTIVGRYRRLGDTAAIYISLTIGSTTALGSAGAYYFLLPAGLVARTGSFDFPLQCFYYDVSTTTRYPGTGLISGGTATVLPTVSLASGTYATVGFLGPTIPVVVAAGDVITVLGLIEVD